MRHHTIIYINILLSIFYLSCNKIETDSKCKNNSYELQNTSYNNFKNIGLIPQNHPLHKGRDAIAFSDFSQDGTIDMFVATLTYSPSNSEDNASDSHFEFFIKDCNSNFVLDSSYTKNLNTCIHPRKALVNDFNNDSIPDIFVVCHGYDSSPFPGEKNKIVLSNSLANYSIFDASDDIGFFHSGSSYDYNKDGKLDVILVDSKNSNKIIFLKNNGNGTFINEGSSRAPNSIKNKSYYTIEFIDIDGDSDLDMLLGGHEWEINSSTQIYKNPGNDNFSQVDPINLPSVVNEGVILDFIFTQNDSSSFLWVLRTSGGDGTFYKSRTIQKIEWPNLNSSTPVLDRNLKWIPWIIPSKINGKDVITSDNSYYNFTIEY